MDHQVSPEPENGHSEEEEDETSDLDNGSKQDMAKLCSSPAKLFTFSVVNSYGTANISPLPCDGNVLQLNRKHLSNCTLQVQCDFHCYFVLTQPLSPPSHCSTFHSGDRLGHRVKEAVLRRTGS